MQENQNPATDPPVKKTKFDPREEMARINAIEVELAQQEEGRASNYDVVANNFATIQGTNISESERYDHKAYVAKKVAQDFEEKQKLRPSNGTEAAMEQELPKEKYKNYKDSVEKKKALLDNTYSARITKQGNTGVGMMGAAQKLFTSVLDMFDNAGLDETEKKELKQAESTIKKEQAPYQQRAITTAQTKLESLNKELEEYRKTDQYNKFYDPNGAALNGAILRQKRIIEETKDALYERGPWANPITLAETASGGVLGAIENLVVALPVVKKLEAKEELSKGEQLLIDSMIDEQEHFVNAADYVVPFSHRTAKGVMNSVEFMLSMTIGSKGSSAIIGNVAKETAKKSVGAVIANVAKELGRTALTSTLMPTTYDNIANDYIGTMEYDDETGKVLLRQDLYDKTLADVNKRRATDTLIFNKYSQRDNLTESEKEELEIAKARLGKESTMDIPTHDDMLDSVKPMSAARAIQHGITSNMAEIVAERYIGAGIDKVAGKILIGRRLNNYVNKLGATKLGKVHKGYKDAIRRFENVAGTGKIINSIPSEVLEEYGVAPLQDLNDSPGDWDNTDQMFTLESLTDVVAQTAVMGVGFRALGMVGASKERMFNKERYKKRSELRKKYNSINNAVEDDDVNTIINVLGSQSGSDIHNTKEQIRTFRAEGKDKEAAFLENSMFTNMMADAFKTGTISELETSLEKASGNSNLSEGLRQAALTAKLKVGKMKDTYKQFQHLPNVGTIMEHKLREMVSKESVSQIDNNTEAIRQDVEDEFLDFKKQNSDFADIESLDDLVGLINNEPEVGKEIIDAGFNMLEAYFGLVNAKGEAINQAVEARQEMRKASSPKTQAKIKDKAIFMSKMNEAFNEKSKQGEITPAIIDEIFEELKSKHKNSLSNKDIAAIENDNKQAALMAAARQQAEKIKAGKEAMKQAVPEAEHQPIPEPKEPKITPELKEKLSGLGSQITPEEFNFDPDKGTESAEVEGALVEESFDFDDFVPLSTEGFSEEAKKKAKSLVAEIKSAVDAEMGGQASFSDVIEAMIEATNKGLTEDNFNVYKMGWEANNFPATDFAQVYRNIFDPLKPKLSGLAKAASDLFEAKGEEALSDLEKEETKEVLTSEAGIVFNPENVGIRKIEGDRTTIPDLIFGYSAFDYDTEKVDGVWRRKQKGELKESPVLNFRKILDPDKFNVGYEASAKMAPEELWDDISINFGVDSTGRQRTAKFGPWLKSKEAADPNFRNTDEFRNMVPMLIYDGGEPVAYVHDVNWYNPLNVADAEGNFNKTGEIEENHLNIIQEGIDKVIAIRKAILANGEVSIKVQHKKPGITYKIPLDQPAITIAEANPEAIIAVRRGGRFETSLGVPFKGILLNSDEGLEKHGQDGHVWDIRRIGTNEQGKKTYKAFKALRKTDDGKSQGIPEKNLETLRWLWAAQAKLTDSPSVQDYYRRNTKGTKYDMSVEKAQQIVNSVLKITQLNISTPEAATTLMNSYGVIRGVKGLTPYAQHLFRDDVSAVNFAQNTELSSFSLKSIPLINENGDVEDTGMDYNEYLKHTLHTAVKSFNVGTQENPIWATSLQPQVVFSFDQVAKGPSLADEVQTQIDEKLEADNVSDVTAEQLIKDVDKIFEDNGIDLDSLLGEDFEEDLSPTEITDISVFENIFDVAPGLTIIQERKVVNFLFNELLVLIDTKYDGKVDRKSLSEELKYSYNKVAGNKRHNIDKAIVVARQLVAANPTNNTKLQLRLKGLEKLAAMYDSIENHWGVIEQKAINEATKYTDIKENIDKEDTEDERDLTEREKQFDKSSIEETGKQRASYALRRFMAGIRELTPQGEVKSGFLGLPNYIGFDDVYNSVAQFYSGGVDIVPDYDVMMAKLRSMQGSAPWVKDLVTKLESPTTPEHIKKQFVTNFTRHALSMKFVMYSTEKDSSSLKVYDTNANEIQRKVRDSWKNNFKANSHLVKRGTDLYSINKEYAKTLADKYDSWDLKTVTDDELLGYLSEFGIELTDATWVEIKKGNFFHNGAMVPFNRQFLDTGGLFKTTRAFLSYIQTVPDNKTEFEETESNHPHKEMGGVLNTLSALEANFVTSAMTMSFRDGQKQFSGQVPPKLITDTVSALKREAMLAETSEEAETTMANALEGISLTSKSTILQLLKQDPEFKRKFKIHHLGATALKEHGSESTGFSSITDLNSRDHDLTKIGGFQDLKQGDIAISNNVGGFKMRMANMFLPTMSDKTQMLFLQTGVYNFMTGANAAFNHTEEGTKFTFALRELLYEKMVYPELDRIMKFYRQNEGKTNINNYDKAAGIFNFVPSLNNVINPVTGNKLIMDIGTGNLEVTHKFIEEFMVDGVSIKELLIDQVENLMHQKTANKLGLWEDFVERKGDGTIGKIKFFDQSYLNQGQSGPTLDQKFTNAAYDFVLNSFLTNADAFSLFAGDPALYAKSSDFKGKQPWDQTDDFYTNFSRKTGVNIGKRLALFIAPGTKINGAQNEKYIQLFMDDASDISENIEYLIKIFYGEVTEETKNLLNEYKGYKNPKTATAQALKEDVVAELQAKYPKIKDYFNIESTDAQEYTTMNEHLHIMREMGNIKDKDFKAISNALLEGRDLTKEQLGIVMQPMKPVYTGQIIDPVQNVVRTMYIKSSSFPLLPQLTANTRLDKLRAKMEDIEVSQGKFVRASYQTANKVGAMSSNNTFSIHDDEGLANAEKSMLVLNRKDFKIQQDVPYKSDKKKTDVVSLGTQIFKLLFGDGMMAEKGFTLPGVEGELTGAQMYEHYTDTFNDIITYKKQELYEELGLDKDGKSSDPAKTANKLQKLLKDEAIKRDYPLQAIKGLDLEEKTVITNGVETTYYEFKVPLWLAASSNNYESLLNSIVTNRIMKHKMPGNSYVAGSENGFDWVEDSENKADKSRIVYLDGFNGKELKATQVVDGKLHRAQVLIPAKFKDTNNKLINIYEDFDKATGKGKYLYTRPNGALGLKTGMIDPELLQNFTFRTPTSGHVSASVVEVVGFLPPESGDLMIVPKNFTKQKGLDYDVDKETAYALHHVVDYKTGKIEVFSEKHRDHNLARYNKIIDEGQNAINEFVDAFGEVSPIIPSNKPDMGGYPTTNLTAEILEALKDETRSTESKKALVERELNLKLAENKFVRINNSILSNPSEEVQRKVNQVLSMEFAGSQADLIEELVSSKEEDGFSFLDDEYQKQKMGLGAAGKLAIGVYSNNVTFHGLAQQLSEPIRLKMPSEDTFINKSVIFGALVSDGTFGRLTTLAADGSNSNGDRHIADVFAEKQNTATDNEKEQILGRVNINSTTIGVDALLTSLGFDKVNYQSGENKGTISLPYFFLSQPIIRRYVKAIEDGRGVTAEYKKDLEEATIAELTREFTGGIYRYSTAEGFVNDTQEEPEDLPSLLTGTALYEGVKGVNSTTIESAKVQIAALETFLDLQKTAKSLSTMQSVINTNNLGKSIIESNEVYDALAKFDRNEEFENITKLIGEFQREMIDPPAEYIRVGEVYIKPTTPQGQIVVNGLAIGSNLWSKYFPYSEPEFTAVFKQLEKMSTVDTTKEYKRIEFKQDIVKNIKRYINSRGNGVFNELASEERKKLFIDTETNVSLATYLSRLRPDVLENNEGAKEMRKGIDVVKGNTLVNKFTYDLNIDGSPSIIKFNNTSNDAFDETNLYNAIPELIAENKPLPDRNGKPYSTVKLAQDLVAYAYLEGGVQEAIQFIKYIPIEYIENVKINTTDGVQSIAEIYQGYNAERKADIFEQALGINVPKGRPFHFVRQYIQHNPKVATQYTKEQRGSLFTNKKPNAGNYDTFVLNDDETPAFISIKVASKSRLKQDKWKLYEHVGNGNYTRLDVLGTHGMNEYQLRNNQIATTIIGKESMVKKPAASHSMNLKKPNSMSARVPLTIKENMTVNDALDQIMKANIDAGSQLSTIAKYLKSIIKDDVKIIYTDRATKGAYSSVNNVVSINPNNINDPMAMAKVIVHEAIHAVSSRELRKYYVTGGEVLRVDIAVPEYVRELHNSFKEFRKTINDADLARVRQQLANKEQIADDDIKQVYPAHNIYEFLVATMSEPDFQAKLNKIPYPEGNVSLGAKISEAILKMIKALAPSITDKLGVKAINDVIRFIEAEHNNPSRNFHIEKGFDFSATDIDSTNALDNPPNFDPENNQDGEILGDLLPLSEDELNNLPDCI